jgi:hypothetical protein
VPGRFSSAALYSNPELERAIAEAPYDEERWVVEDWLLEQADPRAVIVRLEKAGRIEGARRVQRRLYAQLLGSDENLAALLYNANWRAGYLREVHFAANDIDSLGALCRAPAARILRRLTLSIPRARVRSAMAAIAAGVFAETLHDLTVSNVHVDAPLVEPFMLARLARLRRLALRGAYITGTADIPRIESVLIAPTRYDIDALAPMLRQIRFPDVTDFVLDLSNFAEPAISQDMLEPLVGGQTAPRIERLEVRDATPEIARCAIRLLATSAPAHLRTVNLGPVDAAELRREDRFEKIAITVPENFGIAAV